MSTTRVLTKSITKTVIYIVCIFLAVLSIFPFWVMFMNATRGTFEIQQHAVSLVPSSHLLDNLKILLGKSFNPLTGFYNSLIISCGVTLMHGVFLLPDRLWLGSVQLEITPAILHLHNGGTHAAGAGIDHRFLPIHV